MTEDEKAALDRAWVALRDHLMGGTMSPDTWIEGKICGGDPADDITRDLMKVVVDAYNEN